MCSNKNCDKDDNSQNEICTKNQKCPCTVDDKMNWNEPTKVCEQTKQRDAKELHESLFSITHGCPTRATRAIVCFLAKNSNHCIWQVVCAAIQSGIDSKIVLGLRNCIFHHTTDSGRRTTAAKTLVKNIVSGAIFHLVDEGMEFSMAHTQQALGVSKRQIKAMHHVKQLIDTNSHAMPYQLAERKDRIVGKVVLYIYDYLLNDEYTQMDTKQGMREVVDPRTGKNENIHMQIWLNLNKKEQNCNFIKSIHYMDFQRDHRNATVGCTTFINNLAKVNTFVSNPKAESCVDKNVSALEHAMKVMKTVLKKEAVTSFDEKYTASNDDELLHAQLSEILQKSGYVLLIKSVCCPKEEQPDL